MHNDKEIGTELIQSFLDISIKEFQEKYWGASQQYLEVMEVLIEDGLPVIARIEENDDGRFAVYFSVKDEKFYYAHYFSVTPIVKLDAIDITPANTVYLRVIHEDLGLRDLLSITSLLPTETWEKGDLRGRKINPGAVYKTSGFYFEAGENEAGNFEEKFIVLLNVLEGYKEELDKLRSIGCKPYITAYWEAYIGNTVLGGFYLNQTIIQKLNSLQLEVDFDIYVSGVSFK